MNTDTRIVCRKCGSTHSLGKYGLTLYFDTAETRDNFVQLAGKELHNATAFPIFTGLQEADS